MHGCTSWLSQYPVEPLRGWLCVRGQLYSEGMNTAIWSLVPGAVRADAGRLPWP